MNINVIRATQVATLPKYSTEGAAAFDLHSAEDVRMVGQTVEVSTGLIFEVPEDHVMLVFSRSGHGFNKGIRLSNCVGVIDPDYRGVVKVKLHSDRGEILDVKMGDRIAQAMIVPAPRVTITEVNEVSNTKRNTDGFGSTGV